MNNRLFTEPLTELREYEEIRERMRGTAGLLSLTGCVEAQKAHIISGLSFDVPFVCVITENDLSAKVIYENLRFYEPDCTYYYPAKDLLFYQADVASNLLDGQRLSVMRALLEKKRVRVVLPAAALMDHVTQRAVMEAERVDFIRGEESDYEEVRGALVLLGYERCAEASMPGQFASRGDILDIWPLTEEHPVRIEYYGDEIDSMRTYDPATQRSIEETETVSVYPANDHTGMTAPFISWFDGRRTEFFLDEPNRLMEAAQAVEAEFRESVAMRLELESASIGEIPEICGADALRENLNRSHAIALSMLDIRREGWVIADTFGMTVQSTGVCNNHFEVLTNDITRYRKKGYRVAVLSASHTRARRITAGLNDSGIPAYYTEDRETPLQPGQVAVLYGHASRGFEYPLIKFAVIAESDIFGEKKVRRQSRPKNKNAGRSISSFSELKAGDYVVHENHGLGIYKGLEKVEVDGTLKDYMKIEYNGSNLYVLATQLDRLQKYSGAEGAKPKLNRLGGDAWNKTRQRVRTAVKNIAKELVELYAARQEGSGFVYSRDTEWQREFEEMFPFEETEDQLAAIEDVKHDMESTKIMDRLICGDVGYGKTEVALRAAFKAVQDGRQVAYLAPTTILAQQHFNTFTQRMKDYPVRVDLLCRFRTTAQQDKTIRDLKRGLVDVVIGTHRLLSKDVNYKDLGLLIIDEEQRFGVTHKEKIKQLRKDVDVLTLTATPIPRTLHMSLIGIRDMSVLQEPPQDRVPIQTYVMEYNPELVREAICREMARGGQVYYVYNRVKDISETASKISALVPEARVGFADGQMDKNSLESVMVDFINGAIDVLVTTTIIETGLDISNVNTMIIQDADKMGLSQLYQLRGRVGRSNRTAYAFLMYKRDKLLKETAEKRLSAIREFTELGSGIRIAMRDLEIRGAGNLLGAEQSGHMEAVGYDLYCKMLSEAVGEARGLPAEEDFETVVDLNMDAFIPDSYIPDEYQKLDFYKKIAAITNEEDKDDVIDELIDRCGEYPPSVANLLSIAELKALAHRASITEIKQLGFEVRITPLPDPGFDVLALPGIIGKYGGRIRLHSYESGTYFTLRDELAMSVTAGASYRQEAAGRLLDTLLSFTSDLAGTTAPSV